MLGQQQVERTGELTLKGQPLTVVGPKLKPGDKFPAVTLTATDWSAVDLGTMRGAVRLISVVPSLDTGICDAQTKRFNEEAEQFGDKVKVITVSADLPWAQRRWMNDAEVKNITVLSDHKDMAFGNAVGTHVKEMRIEQRAIFVVDKDDTVTYAEYVPEIAQHPDYDAAIEAVKKLI
ncbi:MAG: thiol peroxidase [Thermoflexales bacterium]